ncbi:MAG: phosphoribosyl-ATP diphosphatase [Rhodospirillaceae bacterium]|jgi:phosphoribosyl-ATP pyrophosphohydrolase|nr:phosphoribosyl-ATP diphosphatase [Rhodospirillaceae bacterium]MBT3492300.1 phosphoribosyl-ATP diphosphatase [Rhodospirillaceae bacterium]MBT3782341.1 phosphoribosyl-ATP diphosphatase [Rhodospirillaceae bacterium]MBT3975155.1 phosphoribosyl-ATP diphosphatase [Rhodospirillaceae bacterium]MBT4166837.1 phosphoribosyl-ATP diphosphatase [Rhodospirillaceae bacterium]
MSEQETAQPARGSEILDQLYAVIEERRGADPSESWTAKLLHKGLPKICQKVGEEATEVVIAALAESREELLEESADLLYHLLVLWAAKGVQPDEVYEVLRRRRIEMDIKKKKQKKLEKQQIEENQGK